MLTPSYLDRLPDAVRALYAEAEQEIINDIARRISQDGYLSPTGLWQYQRLSEIRWTENTVIQRLSEITGRAQTQIRADFDQAMRRDLAHEDSIHAQVGNIMPPLEDSASIQQIISAGLAATLGEFVNLTGTTANNAGKQLERILDVAQQKILSGAFTQDQAVRSAIKQLSANGIQSITYASGHRDYIDTVVRRSLLTGVNQTAGQINMQRCRDAGCGLVEVSAHGGARVGVGIANHAGWQGKIYSIGGLDPRYPHFELVTGYGQGAGLAGYNCRHNYSAWYEGISERAYSDELLDEYTAENIPYNGKNISREQADKIQRYNERQIRKWKREADGLSAAGLDNGFERGKVRQWQATQRDFIDQTGLKRDYTRERAGAQYAKSQILQSLSVPSSAPQNVANSITEAQRLIPAHHLELANRQIARVRIQNKDGYGGGYDGLTNTIYLSNTASVGDVIHETAHALDKALGIHNDPIFIGLQRSVLQDAGSGGIIKDKESFSQTIYRAENLRLISTYQGRMYIDENSPIDETQNPINMKEYFAEGYREYIENPQNLRSKDLDLYEYIERIGTL